MRFNRLSEFFAPAMIFFACPAVSHAKFWGPQPEAIDSEKGEKRQENEKVRLPLKSNRDSHLRRPQYGRSVPPPTPTCCG